MRVLAVWAGMMAAGFLAGCGSGPQDPGWILGETVWVSGQPRVIRQLWFEAPGCVEASGRRVEAPFELEGAVMRHWQGVDWVLGRPVTPARARFSVPVAESMGRGTQVLLRREGQGGWTVWGRTPEVEQIHALEDGTFLAQATRNGRGWMRFRREGGQLVVQEEIVLPAGDPLVNRMHGPARGLRGLGAWQRWKVVRSAAGLLAVNTPSGLCLHFDNRDGHLLGMWRLFPGHPFELEDLPAVLDLQPRQDGRFLVAALDPQAVLQRSPGGAAQQARTVASASTDLAMRRLGVYGLPVPTAQGRLRWFVLDARTHGFSEVPPPQGVPTRLASLPRSEAWGFTFRTDGGVVLSGSARANMTP